MRPLSTLHIQGILSFFEMFIRRLRTNMQYGTIVVAALITAFVPLVAISGVAHAVTDCSPDGVEYSGSSWLNGDAVNVCNDTGDGSSNYVNNINGTSTLSGAKWQCVEMVNRLYLTKGWITSNWAGNGGGSSGLIYHLPSNLTDQVNGSISYVNPGDTITFNNVNDSDGHAAIVNSVDSNGTLHIINQNVSSSNVTSTASISSGSLSGGNATYNSSWTGYSVQAIVHQPNGPFTSAPTAFVDPSGNYNVLAEQFGNSVQYERSGSTWNGQPISSSTTLVGTHPPLALTDSSGNYHLFVATGGGVNEYDKASGSTSWNSGSLVESTDTPTSGIGGFIASNGNYELFFDTSGGFEHWEFNGSTWNGEAKTGAFISTPSAFQDSSGNFQVFLQSTGSIDQYIKYTSGTWGSGAPATMSGIISQPWAFQDATGNINFFFNTSGGSDHYEYSGGSWGSEVALSNSSLIYWPFAYHITISGTDYYVVIVETASGITDWWRPTSGGTWSHETTATVTPTSGMVGYVDGSNNQNMFVNTLTTLNHYENSGAGWGGEQVYHD